MKVILLQDVAKIGRRNEEVTVPNGYGLNMLIPKGLAEAATPENRKRLAARKTKQIAAQNAGDAAFTHAVQGLTAEPLTVAAPANDQGHLFEAVKAETIAEAAAAAGQTLHVNQIHLAEPIKSLGEHSIALQSGDSATTITITVVAA